MPFTNRLTYIIFVLLLISFSFTFNRCNSTDSEPESESSVDFDSGTIAPEGTFSYTFEEEVDVDYHCQIHAPNMDGEVVVSSSTEAVDRDTVYMENNQFNPKQLFVAPNTEVVWINQDDVDHTVTSGSPTDDGGGGYNN